MITETSVELYEGVTVYFRGRLMPGGYNITSFSFSPDSSKFAIGLRDYRYNNTAYIIFNTTLKGEHNIEEYLRQDASSVKFNETYLVKSVCFTADNKRIILGRSDGIISLV